MVRGALPIALLVFLPRVLATQEPDSSLLKRRELAMRSAPPLADELRNVRSDRITRALQSPESLYAFVTRPQPFYRERRAAAVQGKGLIPMSWMPRLWEAMRELTREEAVQGWGLKPHPMSAAPHFTHGSWPEQPKPAGQTVLGQRWRRPAELVDYPLTPAEREAAPWPWQVEEAIRDLYAALVPSTFSPLEREKAESYLATVLTLPCATDEEAQSFVSAASASSHFKSYAVMGALRNIALNPAHTNAATSVASSFADATRLWDDSLSWAIGASGTLDILLRSPHPLARENAAYGIRSLRDRFRREGTARMPLPARVILEAGRFATDSAAGDDWRRLYAFAFSIAEAMDAPPFPADRRMDPQSPIVRQRLEEFARWLNASRDSLTALAASQEPQLRAAEAAMTTPTCGAR